ncbi:MAG: CHAT domain-containing protein [Terriglobales bacterium]
MLMGQQRGAGRSGPVVRRQSAAVFVVSGTFFLLLACLFGCSRSGDPQAVYDHAYKALVHGDLIAAQNEAHRECQRFRSNPEWAWKFRTLEARAVHQQGHYPEALEILKSAPTPSDPDLAIPILALEGEAYTKTHNFPGSERALNDAKALCATPVSASCGYLLKARGILAAERHQSAVAEQLFELTSNFARSHGDALLECYALLNLGYESLAEGRFDEAIDRSEAAYRIAQGLGAQRLEVITTLNIGWAHYKLGDSERALELMQEAEKLASQIADVRDQGNALTNIGYIDMDERKFDLAAQSFQQALGLAQGINAKEDVYNARRVLARLSLQMGDLANASQYAHQALEMARQDRNHLDELYPMVVEGQIAARSGKTAEAETTFLQVEHDTSCPVFLKWEAEHSLARLYEEEQHADAADKEYRLALATFETARADVRHEDSQISFLTNAARIYDDYVHFLVMRGKTDDALRWADYSRARTLAEGLGLLAKTGPTGPPTLDARQIARRTGGTLLFYWLGEKQSYLWAITPQKSSLFTLPPGKEIDEAVQRYSEALKVQDVLTPADKGGQALYQTLIGPARELVKKDAKVFVIPDGRLNNLNFETLLVSDADAPEPKVHYWIEDVTIADASSLRVLAAAPAEKEKRDRSLLLVGDSVAPNDAYRELPKAAAQMQSVASHFSADMKILTREKATPSAYLGSAPENFSYIHFVAHGTASRLSPLDSAIVLSKDGADDNSFKLYARDIIRHSLRANLVTISACYSAGERSYSGEGLVGLSWAFLRAGAHNVVAALWDVSDASTSQLMDRFYDELNKGASVDAALRTAKLSLLQSKEFHNAFYWAPFQLYARLG